MTKHEEDVIGGLSMTDQISNEAYKQIMIAAQDENEVCDVLDEIRAEIKTMSGDIETIADVLGIIDKYRAEMEVE